MDGNHNIYLGHPGAAWLEDHAPRGGAIEATPSSPASPVPPLRPQHGDHRRIRPTRHQGLFGPLQARHPGHGRAPSGGVPAPPRHFSLHAGLAGVYQYGLIAEEVAAVYPELVVRGTDGDGGGGAVSLR